MQRISNGFNTESRNIKLLDIWKIAKLVMKPTKSRVRLPTISHIFLKLFPELLGHFKKRFT